MPNQALFPTKMVQDGIDVQFTRSLDGALLRLRFSAADESIGKKLTP